MARPGRPPRDPSDPGTIQRTVVDRMMLPAPGSGGTLGDPFEVAFGQRLRTQLMDWPRMNVGAFARETWRVKLVTTEEADELVILVDKFLNGGWRKRGELRKGDGLDTEELEVHLVETWGQGRYRLTPEWHGKEYAPRSRTYDLGDDPAAGAAKRDTASLIADAAEAVGQTVTLSQLKRLEAPAEDEGMKMGDLAQLIAALRGSERPGADPLIAELLRQNQASQAAILEELKALREKGARSPGELAALLPALAPVLGMLLKPFARNPDALVSILGRALGMAPPEPEKGIVDNLMEYLGPLLQSPTAQSILAAIAARLVAPPAGAPVPPAAPLQLPGTAGPVMMPAPAALPNQNGGEPPMPVPLNNDQAHAVAQLVEFVMAGDFANGYACLEMFPQSDPFPGAPMGANLGEVFLMRLNQVKRTADPRVAVPSLRALAPGLDPVRATEFIAYAQRRLIDEEAQETARAAGAEPGSEEAP